MRALIRLILLAAILAVAATWYFGAESVAWLHAKGAPPPVISAAERLIALGREGSHQANAPASPRGAGQPGSGQPGSGQPGSGQAASGQAAPGQTGGAQARPVMVVSGKVERKPMPVILDTVGNVQSVASISLKPRVDSQIVAIPVKEGDAVKAGELLISLDARSIDAQIQQAAASLEKDKAQVAQAQRDVARIESLLATRVASQTQADVARTALTVAQATLAADTASLNNLRVLRTYYDILAPVNGRIGSLPFKVGSAVRAGDAAALAVVNQIDPVYVAFAVPQTSFSLLQQALKTGSARVEVNVPDSPEPALQGRVAFIENAVDAGSGTLTVKAEVGNKAERLWPGQFVRVRLTYRVDPDSVTTPQAALQVGQNGPYVFVVKPDRTVEVRNVVVDRTIDGQAVITKGLQGGEEIVVDGQLRLTPGAKVEIRNASTPEPPAKPAASS